MSRKLIMAAVAVALPLCLLAAGGSIAAAKKKPPPPPSPVTFVAPTTCAVNGKVTFDPPLAVTGSASTVTVTASLTNCSNGTQGGVKLSTGHLSGLVGSVSPNGCTSIPAPSLSGGSISWTPTSQVVDSSGVSVPIGTGSVVTMGKKSFVKISYSGGSVSSGSFANAGASTASVTTTQDTKQLSSECAHGLTNVAFKGTATL